MVWQLVQNGHLIRESYSSISEVSGYSDSQVASGI